VKFLAGGSEREEMALGVTLMVIGALVLQNLVLVAALARFAWPEAVVAVRTLVNVAVVILTSPIGSPILLLAAAASVGLIAWAARRSVVRRMEVVR
jgi:hypothetical protein